MRLARRVSLLLFSSALLASPSLPAAPAKDLEATPQAKAYRTLLKAVTAGDFEGYRKATTKEAAKGIDAEMKASGLTAKQGADEQEVARLESVSIR